MELNEHVDDVPVSISAVRHGVVIDWKNTEPDEILYIPEELFINLASDFYKSLTAEEYYDGIVLSEELETKLLASISKSVRTDKDSFVFKEVSKFLAEINEMKNTHYALFEGP